MIDPTAHFTLRVIVVVILATAAWHKWSDPLGFRGLLSNYQLLPERLLALASLGIMLLESGAAIGVALGYRPAFAVALTLLALYTLAIGVNLWRGKRDIDCGCSGPAVQQTLSGWLVIRNALIIFFVAGLFFPLEIRQLNWFDGLTVVATASCALMLYESANRLAAASQRLVRGPLDG